MVSPIFIPADAFLKPPTGKQSQSNLKPIKVWAALALQDSRVLYCRAEGLSQLLAQLKTDFPDTASLKKSIKGIAGWLKSRRSLHDQSRSISTVLLLQPPEILLGDKRCLPNWSPEDIEAECWLEAASLLQLPVSQLALDFEVQLTAEGQWVARYTACPHSLVTLYVTELSVFKLRLEAITCSSEISQLCEAWGLRPQVLTEALRCPYQGELASDYFDLLEERTTC